MSCGCNGGCGNNCGCNNSCNYFCYPLNTETTRDKIIKAASQYLSNAETTYVNSDGVVKMTAQAEKMHNNFDDILLEMLGIYPWCFLKNSVFLNKGKFLELQAKGLLQSGSYVDTGFRTKPYLYDGKFVFIEEEDFIASFPRYFVLVLELALADRLAIKPVADPTRKTMLRNEFIQAFKVAQTVDQEWDLNGCFEINNYS